MRGVTQRASQDPRESVNGSKLCIRERLPPVHGAQGHVGPGRHVPRRLDRLAEAPHPALDSGQAEHIRDWIRLDVSKIANTNTEG